MHIETSGKSASWQMATIKSCFVCYMNSKDICTKEIWIVNVGMTLPSSEDSKPRACHSFLAFIKKGVAGTGLLT